LVAYRENLVNRQSALRNWINRFLAHETWYDRIGLWSPKGQLRLRAFLKTLPGTDALVIGQKLDELARLKDQLDLAVEELTTAYQASPAAQRLDAIAGIDVISAISIVAGIGPIERFSKCRGLDRVRGFGPWR
jgi:transposase